MKLWQKEGTTVSEMVEQFTVGRDKEFDVLLARYDVQGSIAHVRMLGEVGLMTTAEADQAVNALHEIAAEIDRGAFMIEDGVEDVHSQVELLLTRRIGEAGKKIHSGRSRNDQVAVDIKLYLRDKILELKNKTIQLFDLLQSLSEKHRNALLPGYTHFQVAMPSSFGLWFGAWAESLVDDMELLAAAYAVTNKNPLGSGAGYGSSFPLNRQRTTELLGFASMNYNAVYAQMTRGKTEKVVATAAGSIAATLSRLSMDCCLYLSQDLDFISFPAHLTTGSSIMPHKKNPDVFELIRARCNRIQSLPNELALLLNNLPSGYHRDLQLTKEILFPGLESLKQCIEMMILMLTNIQVKDNLLEQGKYNYIFSVEAVNQLVNEGMPFRDAYKTVGDAIAAGSFTFRGKQLQHTHTGSIGNLSTNAVKDLMNAVLRKFPAAG